MNEPCSAIILAGGQSRRMGQPKAWLDFHGRPLLAHMVELLSGRFDEIIVVAAPGQELPKTSARIVRDDAPGCGPVAGLAVGLREVTNPLAFATAVDAPLLRLELIDLLLGALGDEDAAVPEWEGRLQPLCGIFRAATVQPVLASRLARGDLRLTDALPQVDFCTVPEARVRDVDPDGRSFLAANTPEQYERLLRQAD